MTSAEAKRWCEKHVGKSVTTNVRYDQALHSAPVFGELTCTHTDYFCLLVADNTGGGCEEAFRCSYGNFDRYPNAFINLNEHEPRMSRITEFFQELSATPEEKLLKKHGIEDPIGTPTPEGLDLMVHILYKENRAKVIELARKMEEEEKENEKKS